MTESEIIPTTPAECRAAQERVKGLLEGITPPPWNWRRGDDDEDSGIVNWDTDVAEKMTFPDAQLGAESPTLARQYAALLAAHAEALSGIEGLAIAWEATAARIRRTEVRPDGQWIDIESAQVHDSLITCTRQLRALLPSPPVEELASPDDDESETDFLVGQRVIVHGTLTHIHDTSDGEDADEFSGEPGVIVADVTDNPYYHHLVYVPRTQRVYGCVIADLSDAAWGAE